jgi:DNA polymerase-3 subunit chi
MTERVDFYILKDATPRQGWSFACRLTEKAYLRSLSVAILADTEADARSLDELLWTFNERSFVPHEIFALDSESTDAPIYLTADPVNGPRADLLVNLSNRLPERPERFGRIAEIIDADAERKRLGRERFKSYRELQLPLETHQLDALNEV